VVQQLSVALKDKGLGAEKDLAPELLPGAAWIVASAKSAQCTAARRLGTPDLSGPADGRLQSPVCTIAAD